jgi:NAD-dependent SIR2 family protein deacetylase
VSLTVPVSSPTDDKSGGLEELLSLWRGRKMAVLSGAGISTDSGIPDYRGEGAPRHHPMTLGDFLSNPERRRRYWLGSHVGWQRFRSARPNGGHQALARMEARGAVDGVITQNVDGLHQAAGSSRVVDLHGRLDRVRCLRCGQSFHRDAIAGQIEADNPGVLESVSALEIRPDGDVDATLAGEFRPPQCDVCQGVLKPEVVFFGEFVPRSVFDRAADSINRAEGLVVAGSSLVVNTGMRLVRLAHSRRIPIVIINRGATKADQMASVRIDGGVTETLEALDFALRVSTQ